MALRSTSDRIWSTGNNSKIALASDAVYPSWAADEELRALPPSEIRPADGRFFDYQQKYDADGATELCPAPSLDEAADRRVRELAVLAHEAGGCDGYSRVDFIVPPAGDPVLLEVNTLPGLTERSLLPQEDHDTIRADVEVVRSLVDVAALTDVQEALSRLEASAQLIAARIYDTAGFDGEGEG